MSGLAVWLKTLTVGEVVSFLATICALALAIWKVVLPLIRLFRKLLQFLEDWNGEPERPGIRPAVPGVLKRLRAIEYELHPNGGGSMRDDIQSTRATLESSATERREQIAQINERLDRGGL